jgi:hypothetical protein
MIAITSEGPHRLRAVILSGVLCGIAYLIRYNAVFLLVPGLAAALWGERRWSSRATLGAAYLASFLVTVAPWLWMNYTHHGSPFYSTNYEDVARAFDITRSTPFTSLADVLLHDPARFARRYVSNLGYTFFQTLGAGLALLPVGPLAAMGIGLSLARNRRRPVFLVLLAALSFLLVMSLTPLGEALFLLHPRLLQRVRGVRRLRDRRWVGRALGSMMAAQATMAVLVLWIVVPSIVTVWQAAAKTLSRQPVELLPAAEVVRREAAPRATVMAVRAQMAYLSRREWRPLPGADSVEGTQGPPAAGPAGLRRLRSVGAEVHAGAQVPAGPCRQPAVAPRGVQPPGDRRLPRRDGAGEMSGAPARAPLPAPDLMLLAALYVLEASAWLAVVASMVRALGPSWPSRPASSSSPRAWLRSPPLPSSSGATGRPARRAASASRSPSISCPCSSSWPSARRPSG